jgi:hypothetical protein
LKGEEEEEEESFGFLKETAFQDDTLGNKQTRISLSKNSRLPLKQHCNGKT